MISTSNSRPAGELPIEKAAASWADYLAMTRPDHCIKHVFVLPGALAALALAPSTPLGIWPVIAGIASAVAVASANYVINEWLDGKQDARHPAKSKRPAACKRVLGPVVLLEYGALLLAGLYLASEVGATFLIGAMAFIVSGLLYNVPPLRFKERTYADSLIEAANNPIRMLLGWAVISPDTLPPASLLFAYWMGGAFLMTAKRLTEYREGVSRYGIEVLAHYRRTFALYTERKLLLLVFLYAQLTAFFTGIFLVKYRIEFILALPLLAVILTYYLRMTLVGAEAAQAPERLLSERRLLLLICAAAGLLSLLAFVDFPALEYLMQPQIIRLGAPR